MTPSKIQPPISEQIIRNRIISVSRHEDLKACQISPHKCSGEEVTREARKSSNAIVLMPRQAFTRVLCIIYSTILACLITSVFFIYNEHIEIIERI